MHVTMRRYEGVDETRREELAKKVIEAGNGVVSSIGFFDTSAQADESTRVAATWVRDEKLDEILKNPPKVTDGEVIAHKSNGAVKA